MKLVRKINLVLLGLLSLSAGAAKVMQVPAEVGFFQDAGLSIKLLILLGAVQLAGGILLLFQNVRKTGATIMAVTFLISSIVIFINGTIAFGVFSFLPIVMAFFVIRETSKTIGESSNNDVTSDSA